MNEKVVNYFTITKWLTMTTVHLLQILIFPPSLRKKRWPVFRPFLEQSFVSSSNNRVKFNIPCESRHLFLDLSALAGYVQ